MSEIENTIRAAIHKDEACVFLLPDSLHWQIEKSLLHTQLALQFVADNDEKTEALGVIQLAADELSRLQDLLDRETLKNDGLHIDLGADDRHAQPDDEKATDSPTVAIDVVCNSWVWTQREMGKKNPDEAVRFLRDKLANCVNYLDRIIKKEL